MLWKAGKSWLFRFFDLVLLFISYSHSLSAILISEFTLDLRRQNFTRTNITSTAMDITLPRFHSFGGVLQHVHQSFMTEMRDVENITTNDSDITLESPVDEESPQDHDISG